MSVFFNYLSEGLIKKVNDKINFEGVSVYHTLVNETSEVDKFVVVRELYDEFLTVIIVKENSVLITLPFWDNGKRCYAESLLDDDSDLDEISDWLVKLIRFNKRIFVEMERIEDDLNLKEISE